MLSTGASPICLPIPGFERVLSLRTVEDAERVASSVTQDVHAAVVIGAGFVGLEMAENLARRGIAVTIVDAAPQVLTPLDPELAILVHQELVANDVVVEVGVSVIGVTGDEVQLADGRRIAADLVVGAIGVRPDASLAAMPASRSGPHGGIAVDDVNRTSAPDVYAIGDVVEKDDRVSGGKSLIALGEHREPSGSAGGGPHRGTSGRRLVVARHGDREGVWPHGRADGMERAAPGRRRAAVPHAVHSHPMSHATYYPGATPLAMKVLFDADDGTLLGAQAVGTDGVDKRIDVLATAMFVGLPAERLADLELAYAPPYSSAKDPVNMLGYMIENIRSGDCDVVEPEELDSWSPIRVAGDRRPKSCRAFCRRDPGQPQRPTRRAARRAGRPRRRADRRLLRGRTARAHGYGVAPFARSSCPQPRRRLPHVVGGRGRACLSDPVAWLARTAA